MDEPTITNNTKKIIAINKEAVHKICSGQVVFDLAIAVKELLENSLDSGAKSIEIKLVNYGKTCIEVIDNGCGVLENDFETLCLKHHTSKIKDFDDLSEVETFGFRGEALSSLCSLAELSIITRHSTLLHAFDLKFDQNGILIQKKKCARQIGTTIIVKNIFKKLPVRAKEFEKNIKKEFKRMILILYSYCLVCTGIKITCTNTVGNKSSNTIISTNGSGDILNNIISIFGQKIRESLIEVNLELPDKDTLVEYKLSNEIALNFTWECFVSSSSHTLGRSSFDRQFFYINGRPCDSLKISKLVNYVYRKYNKKQYPFIYLNIQLEQSNADINVTPDKRTIFFTQEQLILASIRSNFDRVWRNMQRTFVIKSLEELNTNVLKRKVMDSSQSLPPTKKIAVDKWNGINRHSEKSFQILENIEMKISKYKLKEQNDISKNSEFIVKTDHQMNKKNEFIDDSNDRFIKVYKMNKEENSRNQNLQENNDQDFNKFLFNNKLLNIEININLKVIKMKLNKFKEIYQSTKKQKNIKYKAHLTSKRKDVESELERELTKESFIKMEIIGQFNLGFVLTKLDGDLFIIDQHASDEKFRFEKLSNKTKLKTQKLILPKTLDLSILNETILIDNQRIFEDNGFTFSIDNEECPGHRVKLTGIPVSYESQFGQGDIEELIFLIQEGDSGGCSSKKILRPIRVQQMLASRACRSAIMIGKALNFTDMRHLVTQMSQMENPWSCPHGRPTLRHLFCLTFLEASNK